VQQPSAWLILAVLALLQVLTEIVIGVNYGLAQVLVTPMALLMTHRAAPAAAGAALAPERVADTLLGALIGIVIAVALSSIEDRRTLAHHHQTRLPG
ncbi:MAG: FUSC family protein, partial [Burkholderiales bacterium]|nr:FUSC family protein [Burkholderiales bacterium]